MQVHKSARDNGQHAWYKFCILKFGITSACHTLKRGRQVPILAVINASLALTYSGCKNYYHIQTSYFSIKKNNTVSCAYQMVSWEARKEWGK